MREHEGGRKMIIKTICEECGKEFIGDGGEIKKQCAEHELTEHYNADKIFKERLRYALSELDNCYQTATSYQFKKVSVYEDYYGNIENVSYYFSISNSEFNKGCEIDVYDYKNIPTVRDIKEEVEKYFKSNIKKHYEGVVRFEDWCGGHGADDYVIDGQYIREIFSELLDKKIKITVIE